MTWSLNFVEHLALEIIFSITISHLLCKLIIFSSCKKRFLANSSSLMIESNINQFTFWRISRYFSYTRVNHTSSHCFVIDQLLTINYRSFSTTSRKVRCRFFLLVHRNSCEYIVKWLTRSHLFTFQSFRRVWVFSCLYNWMRTRKSRIFLGR